jgi:hypothetical protein
LQQDMARVVTHVREMLPKAFRQEGFEREQCELREKYAPGRCLVCRRCQLQKKLQFSPHQLGTAGYCRVVPNCTFPHKGDC